MRIRKLLQIPDNVGYLIFWQSRKPKLQTKPDTPNYIFFCLGEILPAMQHDQASTATLHYQGTNI